MKLEFCKKCGRKLIPERSYSGGESTFIEHQCESKKYPNTKEVLERESGEVSLQEYKDLFDENAEMGEEICQLHEEIEDQKQLIRLLKDKINELEAPKRNW